MDKNLKSKWIKALRSGRYRQGQDGLRSGGKYCCLGVLAQINGAKWIERKPFIGERSVGDRNSPEGFLSPAFCGLRTSTQGTLANMNDGNTKDGNARSFKQIADYIEKRL